MKLAIQIILCMVMCLTATIAYAQVPQKFNYQGIARDARGNPLSNQQMSLKLSILPALDAITAEYEETQSVTTNAFGLYTLQIGNGLALTGDMKSVKWVKGNKYIKVAIDANGGSNYVDAGSSQLLSVPYALYADKAGIAAETSGSNGVTRAGNVVTAPTTTGNLNMLSKFNGTANTLTNSQIYDNGSNVGIGTLTPATALHIKKTTATYVTVQADANNSTAAIRLQDNNGTGGELGISKFGDNVTGSFMGISRKRMGVINNSTGPLVLNGGGYFVFGQSTGVTQKARMILDSATGRVGIGNNLAAFPALLGRLDVRDEVGNTIIGNFQNTTITGKKSATLRIANGNIVPAAWSVGVGGDSNLLGINHGQYYIEQEGSGARILIDTNGNIGVGTNDPEPSAILELESNAKGFLPPRMSTTQRNLIPDPAMGLMIFNTTTLKPNFFNGQQWRSFDGMVDSNFLYVGDYSRGGVVAYILQGGDPGYDPNTQHGIIAAPSDQVGAGGIRWDNINNPNIDTYAFSTSGNDNTNLIVAAQGADSYAAKVCYDLILNGYSDWFLPSVDEIYKIYVNKNVIGGFSNDGYWSSNESTYYHAYFISFLNGSISDPPKQTLYRVRAVRAF